MKIREVKINNSKKTIDIKTSKGQYSLPFTKLENRPSIKNRISKIFVDKELANKAVTYILESGAEESIHLDAFLDYNRDPDYWRELTLHQLTVDAIRLIKASGLSKNEIVRRLKTSPSQLYRLLDPTNYKKSIDEMFRLIAVLGHRAEIHLIKEAA